MKINKIVVITVQINQNYFLINTIIQVQDSINYIGVKNVEPYQEEEKHLIRLKILKQQVLENE